MEKLIAIGVPAGAVFDTLELQNEPNFEERGFMQHVKHHNGEDKMATWPVRIDGKTVTLKGAPSLGGDTAEVLESWLGIDAGEFADLKSGRRAVGHCVRRVGGALGAPNPVRLQKPKSLAGLSTSIFRWFAVSGTQLSNNCMSCG